MTIADLEQLIKDLHSKKTTNDKIIARLNAIVEFDMYIVDRESQGLPIDPRIQVLYDSLLDYYHIEHRKV